MHDEIATGDQGRIHRAFADAVYGQYWPEADAVRVLKEFLKDPDPLVRYLAAQDFLIMGDNEGYSTLLDLVQSPTPLESFGQDVRVSAACTLGKYRKYDAADAVYRLYEQTQDGALILSLEKLKSLHAASVVESRGFYPETPSMIHYGLAGATGFIPQISSTFETTNKRDVKAASAWALVMLASDKKAYAYLLNAAKASLHDSSQGVTAYDRDCIRYIGNIQTAESRRILEDALNNPDAGVVQIAALNLIFSQGGSRKANEVIADALSPASNPFGCDLALKIAPKLLKDPRVNAAMSDLKKIDSTLWQRAINRRNWSPYNWIDGLYPVKTFNEETP